MCWCSTGAGIGRDALTVARWLEAHPAVRRVVYPGLPSHPQHDLARRQMDLGGGMLTFQVADPEALGFTAVAPGL